MSKHSAVEQPVPAWFSLRVSQSHTELEPQPERSLPSDHCHLSGTFLLHLSVMKKYFKKVFESVLCHLTGGTWGFRLENAMS